MAIAPLVAVLAVLWIDAAAVAMGVRRHGDDDVDDRFPAVPLPGEMTMEGDDEIRSERSRRSPGSERRSRDDLIVSSSTIDCPSDCARVQTAARPTDAFVYPVARLASSRQPFPSNQRDLGGVTAAIMSIDTSLTEGGGTSGNDLCSPDDEDCDVFSGSGIDAVSANSAAAARVVTSSVASTDDIVYVHQSTQATDSNSSSTSSSAFSSLSTSPRNRRSRLGTHRSSCSPRSFRRRPFLPCVHGRVLPLPNPWTADPRSAFGRHVAAEGADGYDVPAETSGGDEPKTTAKPDLEDFEGRRNPSPPPPRDQGDSIFVGPDQRGGAGGGGTTEQLAMNIGLILGIVIALILLLAMLAFVLFQYHTSKETGQTKGTGGGGGGGGAAPAKKPLQGGPGDLETTLTYSADRKQTTCARAPPGDGEVTVSANNTKRKDVKEWYV